MPHSLLFQSIELCPGSVECLLERARLYEATGADISAMGDYMVGGSITCGGRVTTDMAYCVPLQGGS